MGRLLEEINPIGARYEYTYNAQGLPEELANARGQKTAYEYDTVGRVTSVTDELGTVTYAYDRNGNVRTVTDENGTVSRIYDALNRVTKYVDYRGNEVSYGYEYDANGNLTRTVRPNGTEELCAYNGAG